MKMATANPPPPTQQRWWARAGAALRSTMGLGGENNKNRGFILLLCLTKAGNGMRNRRSRRSGLRVTALYEAARAGRKTQLIYFNSNFEVALGFKKPGKYSPSGPPIDQEAIFRLIGSSWSLRG